MSYDNPYEPPKVTVTAADYPAAAPLSVKDILFSYEGRIPRRVYWAAGILVGLAFGTVIGLLQVILGDSPVAGGLLFLLYIPYMWIAFAIAAKRWHDRDKSGWWSLIAFVPCVGAIWIFVECGCLRGTVGPNQFGPDPT